MSEVEEAQVRDELKRALLLGDTYRIEKIVMQNPDVFTAFERAQIMEAVRKANYGTTNPVQNPDLMILAMKM